MPDKRRSVRLVRAARQPFATFESMWRAAAWDFLEACFTPGVPYEVIRDLRDVFDNINRQYQPL